jgi:type VI secretion system protein ImpK
MTNPFDEPGDTPEDSERTVIRPIPGGRRRPVAPPPAAAAPPPPSVAEAPNIAAPGSPLAVAAAPLLQLLARLRTTAHAPDAGDLYGRATQALRTFEQQARAAGVPTEQVRPAHFALSAAIDDVVLNTPWGAASGWTRRPLVSVFHPNETGADAFFAMLARLQAEPAPKLPVIEIFYLCLSLGFMGRYRQAPRGAADLDRIRAAANAVIVGPQKTGPELSPRWQGVAAPYRPHRAKLPIWVAYAAALAACGALFVFVSTSLNAASDSQYARMLAAPPGQMPRIDRAVAVQPPPPPPPPPEPTVLDRLAAALKPDIDTGAVAIVGTPATPIVRVATKGGFGPAAATVQPPLAAVLDRIGTALKTEPGGIEVIAYTDSQPIHTVKFPSNFQLSAARAEAARTALAHALGDPARINAEGRADADPVASNATPEGREQNRRLEIVLHRQE